MKKYLLVLSNLKLGGAERQAINLARYLKEKNRDVTIVGLGAPGIVCKICEEEKIPCDVLAQGKKWVYRALRIPCFVAIRVLRQPYNPVDLSLIYALSKYIKENKFDICISYCARANTILGCCRLFYKKCRYVWFQRDAGIYDRTEGYQRIAIRNADYIIANGNSGKEWIRRGYGLEAILIYNGVSTKKEQKPPEDWRKLLDADSTKTVCTMVANLSGAKDHMSLLQAWEMLHEHTRGKHLLLVFAGRFDNQYETLYNYAAENELLDQVRFLGQIEDITGLLKASDVCVFGAISEGSPNGVIEAAMVGLPIVATDLPEIREAVSEENYEYLFPKGDINAIVNNILFLAENSEVRQYLGEKNRAKAENVFSIEKNFEKLIAMVEGDIKK